MKFTKSTFPKGRKNRFIIMKYLHLVMFFAFVLIAIYAMLKDPKSHQKILLQCSNFGGKTALPNGSGRIPEWILSKKSRITLLAKLWFERRLREKVSFDAGLDWTHVHLAWIYHQENFLWSHQKYWLDLPKWSKATLLRGLTKLSTGGPELGVKWRRSKVFL